MWSLVPELQLAVHSTEVRVKLAPMVMLITGCRSGIGLAIALAAARSGYVVYAGLRDITTKENLVSQSEGLEIIPLQLDVIKEDERTAAIDQIQREQGRLDVLVNNAGIGLGGFLEEITEEEIRASFDVNFFGVWSLSKAAIPLLRTSKGSLVMISSLSGTMALPGLGAYCASKFALEGMTETWRHELKPFGIDVISIQPGAYKTDISGPNRKLSVNQGIAHPFYNTMADNMEIWYDQNAVAKAYPPSHLAENLMRVLNKRNPKLRYAIGPSTGLRKFLLTLFPFKFLETYFHRVLTASKGKQ